MILKQNCVLEGEIYDWDSLDLNTGTTPKSKQHVDETLEEADIGSFVNHAIAAFISSKVVNL